MMYKEHHLFKPPGNENSKIWRYMDFSKFVNLLDKQALFFCRADKLGDPFEGSYPKPNVVEREQELQQANLPAEVNSFMGANLKKFVRRAAVNCWCLSEHESAALWGLYVKNGQGIAIQSTFKRLKNSFTDNKNEISIVQVEYINYQQDKFPSKNPLNPFAFKRESFEHEKELRAVIIKLPPFKKYGVSLTVTLDNLIDKIYVAPSSSDWFFRLVKSTTGKFGLDKPVLKSDLDNKALY